MPKRLGSAEIIRILEEHGFHFVKQRGSHVKMRQANLFIRGNPCQSVAGNPKAMCRGDHLRNPIPCSKA